jgi:hypothetical protein
VLRVPGWVVRNARLSGGNTVPFPLLQFVDHDPEEPMLSPDGGWVAYVRDERGRLINFGDGQGRIDLWVRRPDGSGARRIVTDVGWWHVWLTSTWLYFNRRPDDKAMVRQLGIADARTGKGQMLTAGSFWHELTDFRDGRFLVEEHPPGFADNSFQSNLYVIQPLRVAM